MKKTKLLQLLRYEKKAKKKGYKVIAGIDEAGRGPLAGPVVACAVIINDYDFTCTIDDSKKLSPARRLSAYQEIIRKAIVGISFVDEDVIDSINIRRATMMAMEEAVINLGVDPDILLIDGNMPIDLPFKQQCIIKGDAKSVSIAAASIIAKVARDSMMMDYHLLYPEYRFDLHKGYGTRLHISAILKHGLSPIHRRSFHLHPGKRY